MAGSPPDPPPARLLSSDRPEGRGKEAAGRAAAGLVGDGMRIGLGTGSTAHWFIVALGDAVRAGLGVTGVATSRASAELAASLGIALVELDEGGLDLAVDGADLVDPDLRLIKGGGGAHVRERIVAAAARRFVVVIDAGKLASRLSGAVAVELLEFGAGATLAALAECGARFQVRRGPEGAPIRSDSGNLIADGRFEAIDDAEGLAQRLDSVPGVIGHGLFLGMADLVLVGDSEGEVRELLPGDGG